MLLLLLCAVLALVVVLAAPTDRHRSAQPARVVSACRRVSPDAAVAARLARTGLSPSDPRLVSWRNARRRTWDRHLADLRSAAAIAGPTS